MDRNFQKTKSRSPMVYWLNTDDVQSVAIEELGRKLTPKEIKKIIEPISENIDWTEAISIAINQHIKNP